MASETTTNPVMYWIEQFDLVDWACSGRRRSRQWRHAMRYATLQEAQARIERVREFCAAKGKPMRMDWVRITDTAGRGHPVA